MNCCSFKSKKFRIVAIAAVPIVAVMISVCLFFRIYKPADFTAYRGMAAECHPVWKEFARRKFSMGDSSAELTSLFSSQPFREVWRL